MSAAGGAAPGPRSMRLGEILLERGKIEAEDLERALELQLERGDKLGKILVDMGTHRPARRAGGASDQLDVPLVTWMAAALGARNRRPVAPLPAAVPRLPGGAGRFHPDHRHGRSAGFRDHRGRARLLRPANPTVLAAEQEILDAIEKQLRRRRAAATWARAKTSRPAPTWNTCATWPAKRRSSAWSTP
jgi:hypothetical protein